MQISVTQKNISQGVSCSPEHCPIALALRDLYPQAVFITVGVDNAFIRHDYESDQAFHYSLPWDAQSFVKNFDLGLSVDPFTFTLE